MQIEVGQTANVGYYKGRITDVGEEFIRIVVNIDNEKTRVEKYKKEEIKEDLYDQEYKEWRLGSLKNF
jgi:hypothetical protein